MSSGKVEWFTQSPLRRRRILVGIPVDRAKSTCAEVPSLETLRELLAAHLSRLRSPAKPTFTLSQRLCVTLTREACGSHYWSSTGTCSAHVSCRSEEEGLRSGINPPYRPGPKRQAPETPESPSTPGLSPWSRHYRTLRRRSAPVTWIVLGVMSILLVLLVWRAFGSDEIRLTTADVDDAVAEAIDAELPDQVKPNEVYRSILPSLVVVQTDKGEEDERIGVGSGVVVNDDGEVITALHVVDGATEIQISFADGTRTTAGIADSDPFRDVAVLAPYTTPNLIVPATIGASSSVRVGDEVFTVGNPLGLVGSMSAGVVSGVQREFKLPGRDQALRGLIQFDAAVNPGNSGGPLLDRRGQVVGIVTGLVNPTDQEVFIGIGFAVPIDEAVVTAGGPAQ